MIFFFSFYHWVDQVSQHHEKSNDMPNTINSTFFSVSFYVCSFQLPVVLVTQYQLQCQWQWQSMLIQLLHHHRVECVPLLPVMIVYADSLDIQSIYYSDTFLVLLHPTEYFPSNYNKNVNQPENSRKKYLMNSMQCKIKIYCCKGRHSLHDTHRNRTLASNNVDRKIALLLDSNDHKHKHS